MSLFVGRERELAELRSGLDAALAGSGSFILLSGEPGIGKTRLAHEIGREAVERGARVLRGGSFEGGGAPPYWPWIQVLRSCSARPPSGAHRAATAPSHGQRFSIELRDLLPELPAAEGLEPDLARFRLFDSVVRVLQAHSKIEPLLVLLDDLQWADESSLLLLQLLVRDLSGARMLVLGAYRDVDAHHSPEVGRCIATLTCDARTLVLGGLTHAEVAALIEDRTHRPAAERVVSAAHGATGGNPLFVDELVRSLGAEGRLDDATFSAPLPLPERVRAVIRRRMDHLSEACRRVLVVAAVIGREFDLARLAQVCATRGDRPPEAIDEAREARIVSQTAGRFAFAHDLFREALYDDLAGEERRSLHAAIGAALEQLYAGDIELHLAELAHHFLHAAPGSDVAIRYCVRAAERAVGQLAFAEAVGHYEAALQGLSVSSPNPARRSEVLLSLGETLWKMGEFDRGRQVYQEAAELAQALALPEALARAALGFGGQDLSYDRANEEPQLVRLLEQALAAIGPADSRLRASLMARLGAALAFSPDRERGEALTRDALTIARRLGDKPTLHFVLCCYVCTTWGPDNLEERLALSSEIARLSIEIGAAGVAEINVSRIAHLDEAGDNAGAEREADSYRRRTAVAGRPVTTWILAVRRAMTALVEGRCEEVEPLAAQALQVGQGAQNRNAPQYFGAQLIALRREQGRLAEMVGAIEEFAAENPALPIWRAALAWVHAEIERTAEAQRELDQLGAADFRDIPRDMYWLACLWILAETAARLGDRRHAETLYAMLRPYSGRCAIVPMAFNGGSLERSLGRLAGTAARYDEAVEHFEAAIAANERIGARPWVAHAEHEYARVLLARGSAADRARAIDLLGRSVTAARALGMTALLARAEPLRSELAAVPDNEAVLRREGEYWTVGYEGSTTRVRDARGLRLISLLLCSPGRDIPATHLAVWPASPAVPRTDGRGVATDLGLRSMGFADDSAAPDARARAEYRARLAALRDEADEADRFNNPLRASRAREEMAAIAEHLGAQVSMHARQRKVDAERARLAVTKAIRYAIRKVERAHPSLGRILAATVKTGTSCRYEPDPRCPLRWRL